MKNHFRKLTTPYIIAIALVATAAGTAVFMVMGQKTPALHAGVPFDGKRAFADMGAIVAQGNRYYGAPGRDAALEGLEKRFSGIAPRRQSFSVAHPDGGGTITMTNVLLRQHPEKQKRFILASHWDTRLWSEEDKDPALRGKPIAGANDGTSGIAVMVEAARILAEHPLQNMGIDYILFDGEEYGRPGNNLYCQGSHYLAAHISDWYGDKLPLGAIVMDMVADANLGIPKETYSMAGAQSLVDLVWGIAAELREPGFDQVGKISIIDDHIPLQQAGIPSILLIDYDYPYWHTQGDTMDRCSAESLARTGNVLMAALQRLDADSK